VDQAAVGDADRQDELAKVSQCFEMFQASIRDRGLVEDQDLEILRIA
jgi:hypothetical protein